MKYVSGRVKELKVGITSHTEEKTPLSVIGNVNITGDIISTGIGITNLNVSGLSTFTGAIDANGDLDVDGHTELDNVNVSGVSTLTGIVTTGSDLYVGGDLYVNDDLVLDNITGNSLKITGLSTFGNTIDANGDLDVDGHTELDNLNVSGIATFTDVIDSKGRIVGAATSNIIPFLYNNFSDLPSAVTYHGAFAHVHGTGKAYYAHAANWYELVNKELNGTVGTGTEKYDIGITSVTNLYVSGISTYDGNLDVQSSVLITGITTISDTLDINAGGQANTFKVEDLTDNRVVIAGTGGELEDDANLTFNGSTFNVGSAITMYQATGIISATSFFGDGSGLENTGSTLSEPSSGTQRLVTTSLTTGTMTSSGVGSELAFDYSNNHLEFTDNTKATFGTGNDLQLYHNATASYIDNNTGALYLRNNVDDDDGGNIIIQAKSGKTSAVFQDDEGVRLYYDDAEKVATTGYGVTVNGTTETQQINVTGIATLGSGASGQVRLDYQGNQRLKTQSWGQQTHGILQNFGDIETVKFDSTSSRNLIFKNDSGGLRKVLEIGHASSNSFITGHVGNISINAPQVSISTHLSVGGISTFTGNIDANGDLDVDGHTELDDLNVTGVSTFSKPVGITSDLQVTGTTRLDGLVSSNNSVITIKNPTFLQINNDGQRLRLKGTGVAGAVESSDLQLNTHNEGETTQHALTADRNSSVKIYHSGNQKLETTSTGVVVTGIVTSGSAVLGSAKVSDLTDNRLVIAGTAGELEDTSKLTFDGNTLAVVGDANFNGNVTVQGTLTSEDKTNIDSIGIVTARTGVRIGAGGLVVTSGVSTFTDAIDSNGDANISGTLNANGDVNLGNATSDTISAVGRFDTDVVPSSDGAKDLGLDAVRWRNLYADVLHGDGSQLTGITAAGTGAIGGLTVKDEGVTVGTAGSVSTFDFRGATITAIANTGAAGIATVTVITEQNQNIQSLNASGIVTAATLKSNSVDINGGSIDNTNIGFNVRAHGLFNNVEANGYVRSTGYMIVADHIEHGGDSDTMMKFPSNDNISFETGGSERLRINSTGVTVTGTCQATDFNSTSDARLKTNVQTITSPLDKINQIDGVTFEWIADNKPSMGVIADTVEKVFPELIGQTLEVSDKDETRYKTVNYDGLIGLLIEAIKEQQVQITELKTKLDSLS